MSSRLRRLLLPAVMAWLLAGPGTGPARGAAETLSGRVEILERGQPTADASQAVVTYTPAGGAGAPPSAAAVEMLTHNRRFQPRVVVVPVGGEVRFPNQDPIRHNVFSVSPSNRFDLGLVGPGPGKAMRFTRPGLVRVFCNVHREMAAFVVVLETPFAVITGADGRFELRGLPAGRGTLRVWHPRAEAWTREIELPGAGDLQVSLEATMPVVSVHLNKFGQPYRDEGRDEGYH